MTISIMAAMSDNRAIGFKNLLPWGSLPADWRNLYEVTRGKKMIMGRKSYEAADRVWSDSGNIVITRQTDLVLDEGFLAANSIERALEMVAGEAEVFIIGGAEIFKQAMPFVDKIHLTVVNGNFAGDAFFPEIDPSVFSLIEDKKQEKDNENKHDFSFKVYQKSKVKGVSY